MYKYLLAILVLVILSSCEQKEAKDQRKVIAKAYDYKLYEEDLIADLPSNLTGNDSVLFANAYINQWLYEKVELHVAENNLTAADINFSRQIADYRNSLVVYEYEKRLIEQRLDTVVTYDQVQAYYDEHKNEFTLKKNIAQVAYIKLHKEDKANAKLIKKLLRSYKEKDIKELKHIADDIAVNYLMDDDTWLFFDDLIKEIPIKTYNQVSFLKNNRVIMEQDSLFTFLVRINDFKIADSVSPIEFEYDRIVSIIINIRKLELVQRMEQEVFKQAQEEGKVQIINL